jgi:hypothetical protein
MSGMGRTQSLITSGPPPSSSPHPRLLAVEMLDSVINHKDGREWGSGSHHLSAQTSISSISPKPCLCPTAEKLITIYGGGDG